MDSGQRLVDEVHDELARLHGIAGGVLRLARRPPLDAQHHERRLWLKTLKKL